jgi:hypothetical protein
VDASPVPLDAWVVEREQLDPLAYAELWVRDGGTAPGTPDYAALVDAWLTDFAARGVAAVGSDTCCCGGHPACPPSALRAHHARSAGGALGATSRRRSPPDVSRARRRALAAACASSPGRHRGASSSARRREPERHRTAPGRRLRAGARGRPGLAALVGACDGDLTVGQLSAAIAELLEVDAARCAPTCCRGCGELVFTGFLRLRRTRPAMRR